MPLWSEITLTFCERLILIAVYKIINYVAKLQTKLKYAKIFKMERKVYDLMSRCVETLAKDWPERASCQNDWHIAEIFYLSTNQKSEKTMKLFEIDRRTNNIRACFKVITRANRCSWTTIAFHSFWTHSLPFSCHKSGFINIRHVDLTWILVISWQTAVAVISRFSSREGFPRYFLQAKLQRVVFIHCCLTGIF